MQCIKHLSMDTVWLRYRMVGHTMFIVSNYSRQTVALDISAREDIANLARYIVRYVFLYFPFFFFRIPMFSFCLCGYDVRREIKLKYIFNNFLN